jgi:hypothetical protein
MPVMVLVLVVLGGITGDLGGGCFGAVVGLWMLVGGGVVVVIGCGGWVCGGGGGLVVLVWVFCCLVVWQEATTAKRWDA